jgi:hypothetical protein
MRLGTVDGFSWGDAGSAVSKVLTTAGNVYEKVIATKQVAKQGGVPGTQAPQQYAPGAYDPNAYTGAPGGFTMTPQTKQMLIIGALGIGAVLLLAPMFKKTGARARAGAYR